MKKFLCMFVAVCVLVTSFGIVSFAADEIKIVINDKEVSFDQMPVIVEGRTLVPLRGISETLGAEVLYTADTKRVTVSRDGVVVKLKIGSTEAYVDRTEKTLDVPATVISDRTMVPVRFISEAYGSQVEWNGDTKTVIIKDNGTSKGVLKELVSDFHRPVPTTFEKSNKIDDVIYYDVADQAKKPLPDEKLGTVVLDGDKFFADLEVKGADKGTTEVYTDEEGVKVFKFTSNAALEKTADYIIKSKAQPEGGVAEEDAMLMMFDVRCTESNIDTGAGLIQLQLEETTSGNWKKAVFDKVDCPVTWQRIYLPCGGVADATSLGIRPGFAKQTIEIKNFKLINYKTNVKIDDLPKTVYEMPFLQPDAAWRQDAFKRIEKERKGDFTVVVKDEAGNVIPDAEVEIDMFEHEFQFGTSIRNTYFDNETAKHKLSENFNAGVSEGAMKWAPYQNDKNKASADRFVTDGTQAGLKYLRGHTLLWEVDGKTGAGNLMVPQDVQDMVKAGEKDKVMEEINIWLDEILPKFKGKLTDWDVVNEIIGNKLIVNLMGREMYNYYFMRARELDPTVDLYYNECRAQAGQVEFFELLDWYKANGVDYDAVGIQTHRDNYNNFYDFNDVIKMYEKIRTEYNKTIKITEYSCAVTNREMQANYTRDSLIAAFAQPNVEGFLFWGYWDGSNFAATSPFYDTDFNLKEAGKVYQDLVYNKWWTRDAKAKSDKDGKAVINGYYGDYDVTVTANGKTATQMVSFHKGYDNVLEITVK